MLKRTTIATIAAQTGLSKFAVSRALAGKSGVSDATRARVSEVAANAGYKRPAALAAKQIGVIFDETDLANIELQMLVQNGVRRETQRLKIEPRFHWIRTLLDLDSIADGHDGLLAVGPLAARGLGQVYRTRIPVVRIGPALPLEQVDTISNTNREGGAAAISHLARLGHRLIAFVHGVPGYAGRMERFRGAQDAAHMFMGVKLHDVSWKEGGGFAEAIAELRSKGVSPTAYFCANDGLAVTVTSQLLAHGYRIPDDASVIGFGDYAAARQISPQLTTLRIDGVTMGEVAIRLLNERMVADDPNTTPLRTEIVNEWVERYSTGPAPGVAARNGFPASSRQASRPRKARD